MYSQTKERITALTDREIAVLRSLADQIPAHILSRGGAYYSNGRIQKVVKDGSTLIGKVLGNRLYTLYIDLNGPSYSCNCPTGLPCKHIASVVFWSLNNLKVEEVFKSEESASKNNLTNNELVFFFRSYYPNLLMPYAKTSTNKFLKIQGKSALSLLRKEHAHFLRTYLDDDIDSQSNLEISCEIIKLIHYIERQQFSFKFYINENSKPLEYGGEAPCYPVIHPENDRDVSEIDAEYILSLFQYDPYNRQYKSVAVDSILYQSDVLFLEDFQAPHSKTSNLKEWELRILNEYLEGLPDSEKPKQVENSESNGSLQKFYVRKLLTDKTSLFQRFYYTNQGLNAIYHHKSSTLPFLSAALKEKFNKMWKAGPALAISIYAKEKTSLSTQKTELIIHGKVEFVYAKDKKSLNPKKFKGKMTTLSSRDIVGYAPTKLYRRYGSRKIDLSENSDFVDRNLYLEKTILEKTNIPFSYKKSTGAFSFTQRFLKRLVMEYLEILKTQNVILRLHENLIPAIYTTYQAFFNIENSSKIDYFEGEIDIPGVSYEDKKTILKAYRTNKEVVKLSNGDWILLDSLNLDSIFQSLNELGVRLLENGKTSIFNKGQLISFNSVNDFEIRAKEKINKIRKNFELLFIPKSKPAPKIPPKMTKVLRHYQKEGVYFFDRLFQLKVGGILADDMGLGKTIQTLAFIEMRSPNLFLVVAPVAALSVWEGESKKFTPDLKTQIWHSSRRRKEDFISRGLILTTYTTLTKDIELFQGQSFKSVFLDEVQHIKNIQGKSAKSVRLLKSDSFFGLTGTPVENYLSDLWALMDIVFPGLLGSKRSFKMNYGSGQYVINKERLLKRISPFILRRTKQQVLKELPLKTETSITLPLQEEQALIYNEVRKEAVDALKIAGRNYLITMLPYLMKLRRICCHPILKTKGEWSSDLTLSGKLSYLSEKLEEIEDSSSGILVFSQFTDVLELASQLLRENGIDFFYLNGSTPASKRKKMVDAFQNGKKKFFLISLKAGGTALTLHRADTIFHLDPWWNPAVENQATDRAHRIGQDKPVFVYKLIAQDTIEEKILFLQERKRQLFDTLFNEGAHPGRAISRDELLELLT